MTDIETRAIATIQDISKLLLLCSDDPTATLADIQRIVEEFIDWAIAEGVEG